MRCFPINVGDNCGIKAFPIIDNDNKNAKKEIVNVVDNVRVIERPIYQQQTNENNNQIVERIIERPIYQQQNQERVIERIVDNPVYINQNTPKSNFLVGAVKFAGGLAIIYFTLKGLSTINNPILLEVFQNLTNVIGL